MTPSVSAVTVIERQRQSTATLTPKTPSTVTLVRKLNVNSVSFIFLLKGPHDSWEPSDEELQQRRDEQEASFCPEDRVQESNLRRLQQARQIWQDCLQVPRVRSCVSP